MSRFAVAALLLLAVSGLRAETNVDAFSQIVNGTLAPRAPGYSYAIVKNGQLAKSGAGGILRTGQNFTTTSQMNVASVSKTVTAVPFSGSWRPMALVSSTRSARTYRRTG